jgi:UDP-N-acetylglucosamine--N-acetylmuramyl-(pentapeptide) pyrophosphoryl-undecaprenol N-acetylglucosamine transferase
MTATRALIVLAAGGTGGHLFPAEALASVLIARGYRVALITDPRGTGFGERMASVELHRISAGGVAGGSLVRRAQSVVQLGVGFFQARSLMAQLKPAVAVGFGGYASVPTILAASFAGVPTVLHEQNAILGRANRLLARRATRIAASFPGAIAGADRVIVTGNPVRPAIAALAIAPYATPEANGRFNLLVTGGSQGARAFGRLLPEAIALLPEDKRRRLTLVQQCRAEDLERVKSTYADLKVAAELAPFFTDIPQRLRDCHLVVARSGASTVAELAAAGRPALLIPYPHATDDHQTANAQVIAKAGGAWLLPEAALTPALLAKYLEDLMDKPADLATASTAARACGRVDAAERLADLVSALAPGNGMKQEAAA